MGLTILLVDDDQILTEKTKNSNLPRFCFSPSGTKRRSPRTMRRQNLYCNYSETENLTV